MLKNIDFKIYKKGNQVYLEISDLKELKEVERIAKKFNAKIVSD